MRAQSGPLADFARKCKAAYHIFFPPRPKTLSPKEEGRNRLRMILVADRCAMNANSLVEMKTSIVNAVSNYVEVRERPPLRMECCELQGLRTVKSTQSLFDTGSSYMALQPGEVDASPRADLGAVGQHRLLS